MDRKSVYVETSIVSYLTARPSGDLLAAARQKLTVDWWDAQRGRFDLYVSNVVIEEANKGNVQAAAARRDALGTIPVLAVNDAVVSLSKALIRAGAVPPKAIGDSLHIAVAAVHGIDYLLTWNYRHIDNAEAKPIIRSVCAVNGYACPEICTPQELMGAGGEDG